MSQVQVLLRNVTKRFSTKTLGDVVAVDNFNFEVYEGEVFSILGLRVVARPQLCV